MTDLQLLKGPKKQHTLQASMVFFSDPEAQQAWSLTVMAQLTAIPSGYLLHSYGIDGP